MARSFASASSQRLISTTPPFTAEPFTVSLWAYPLQDNANGILFSAYNGFTERWNMAVRNTATLRIETRVSGTRYTADTTNTYSANAWCHGAIVVAASNDHRVVLDGDWANSGTETTDATPSGVTNMTLAVESGASTYFNGYMAEVACWNVGLSQAEVEALAAGYSPLLIRPSALISYWPLIGSTLSSTADAIDRWGDNTLTQTNSPTWTDHPSGLVYPSSPLWVPPPATSGGGGIAHPIFSDGSALHGRIAA